MSTTPATSPAMALPASVRTALKVVLVVALLIAAGVHLHLAPGYQQSAPGGIGAGNLFRLQAVAAVAAAVFVLVRDNRLSHLFALAVGLSAVAAVVLYRYVDVPPLGPLPAMYEPVWFLEKSVSAVAEGIAAVVAALLLWAPWHHRAAESPTDSQTQRTED